MNRNRTTWLVFGLLGTGLALGIAFRSHPAPVSAAQTPSQAERPFEEPPDAPSILEDEPREDEERDREEKDNRRERLEQELKDLKIDTGRLQISAARLTLVERIAAINADSVKSATYAIMNITEFMSCEDAIKLLEQELERANVPLRRVIRVKLAELYNIMEQDEKAKVQIRSLIRGG